MILPVVIGSRECCHLLLFFVLFLCVGCSPVVDYRSYPIQFLVFIDPPRIIVRFLFLVSSLSSMSSSMSSLLLTFRYLSFSLPFHPSSIVCMMISSMQSFAQATYWD